MSYADFVTSTTHKTLRGPEAEPYYGTIPDYTKKINSAIFPGTQGGPIDEYYFQRHRHPAQANTDDFKDYSAKVVANAQAMARVFKESGYKLLTDGTDSHILLLDLK